MRQKNLLVLLLLTSLFSPVMAQEDWLADFYLQSSQGNVVVNWTIAKGANCSDVTVERWSEKTEKFDTLFLYAGVCSSNDRDSSFSFIDQNPESGINTYRVCFIRSSSNPLSIFVTEVEEGFALFPNPAQHKTNLALNVSRVGELLEVYDTSGKMVFEKVLTQETTEIELLGLPSGAYYFRLSGNENPLTIKFLKIN